MSHKYRAAIGRESPRPASRGIWRKLNRGVEIADRLFRLPREHRRDNSAFCRLLCANKRRWLPGIRQKGAAANRQTNFCTSMRRNNLPHNNTRVPRRSAFWPKPQKAPKTLFNLPAPGGFRLMASPKVPNQLGESPFLLIRLECARLRCTLTPAAAHPPASAGLARADRTRTECPINIARR